MSAYPEDKARINMPACVTSARWTAFSTTKGMAGSYASVTSKLKELEKENYLFAETSRNWRLHCKLQHQRISLATEKRSMPLDISEFLWYYASMLAHERSQDDDGEDDIAQRAV
jgi:hypothetical protein